MAAHRPAAHRRPTLSAPSRAARPVPAPPAPTLDWSFLRDWRRVLAIILIALAGSAVTVFLLARGELAGADARAYWGAVRVWIDGGDPMNPPNPYMPYVYFPWTLPFFMPWAALPWEVAWFLWRGVSVILLIWTATWAYRQHPLATAVLLAFLAAPIAATLDTGNITLFAALAVWAAHFVGPRLGGGLWALASVLKWFPAPLWLILPPKARGWGLIWAALAAILSLATWPQTLEQLQLAINYPRPFRGDYVLLLWAAVPWLWSHPRWFKVSEWRIIVIEALARTKARWIRWRAMPEPLPYLSLAIVHHVRAFVGMEPPIVHPEDAPIVAAELERVVAAPPASVPVPGAPATAAADSGDAVEPGPTARTDQQPGSQRPTA